MRNYWKYILNSLLVALCISLNHQAAAQLKAGAMDEKDDYYIFPIKPGERNSLAGTMGELRSNHFHSGIDIRTEGRTGLPVYAAADGYISRIVVSTSGYGNTLYILHPNGETTVYAHLDHFENPMADYVRKEQYRRKSFAVDLTPYKGQFPIKQATKIAESGNSGSSGGPHLHFDIRDEYQRPLNPLSYGFEEILDRTPPIAEKIVIRTLNIDARVNGQFGQQEYVLRRVGNDYKIDKPIRAMGEIGIMLDAHDKLDNSRFRCGINTILVEANGKSTFEQRIKRFAFSEQREIYRHMSYSDLRSHGERYHKLYVDDGNQLDFYSTEENKGKLKVRQGEIIPVKITMIDTYGNKSLIDFTIEGSSDPGSTELKYGHGDESNFLLDNTLIINRDKNVMDNAITYNGEELNPAYMTASKSVYLVDLRKELPKVLEYDNVFKSLGYKDMVPSGTSYNYYDDDLDIYFQKSSLFDTLYLQTSYSYDSTVKRELWSIGDEYSPIRRNIKVTLKPKQDYNTDKHRIYSINWKGDLNYEGGNWEGNKLVMWTRDFGTYTIDQDTVPPKVQVVKKNSKDISFIINDAKSGINNFNCYVNGEWVLMNYDYKRSLLWSEKLDSTGPFAGELKLIVTDNTGNETIYQSTIN